MITKDEALEAGEFHYGTCKRIVGPRGGVTIKQTRVRRSGRTQTWKTRPDEFRVPIKYGLYESSEITHRNADEFHTEAMCPLNAACAHESTLTSSGEGSFCRFCGETLS